MKYVKYETGMAVQVLKMRDGKPSWVGGYIYRRAVDGRIRVEQVSEGPGNGNFTEFTHDRVRPDMTAIRFD